MGPGGLATPNRAGVCGRPPTTRPLLTVREDGGVYSPSLRSRAVRLPPTPCRVCFRPCVFNKFSHFWQKLAPIVPQAHAAEPPPPGARPRAISGQNGPVSSYRGALWPPAAGPGVGRVGGNRSSPLYSCPRLAPPARPPGGGGGAPRAPRRSAWLRTRTATTATTATTRGSSSPWMPKIPSSMRTLRRPSYCRGVPAVPAAGPTAVGSACRAVLRTQGTADGSEEVEPRSLEICAYKTAITTQSGQEFWCFAVVVTGGASRHGGSEPDAHLSQVHGGHAAQEAEPCAERQKRRRRAGATSSFNPNPSPTPVSQPALSRARSPTPDPQPGDDIETKIDAEDRMIPPEDIQRVRKLTDEEEQLLRDHVGLGTGGDVLHVGSIFPRSAGTISFLLHL